MAPILAVADGAQGLNVFNVGTGVAWSVKDIVQLLGQILGRTITVVEEPSRVRATERTVLVADIEKIRRATGWTPRILLAGLAEGSGHLVCAGGGAIVVGLTNHVTISEWSRPQEDKHESQT